MSDNISNLLIMSELLTLAASAGSRSVWAVTLKTWGVRHAGCDQDTNVAEMQRKGLLELIRKPSVSVLQRAAATERNVQALKNQVSLAVFIEVGRCHHGMLFCSFPVKTTEWS